MKGFSSSVCVLFLALLAGAAVDAEEVARTDSNNGRALLADSFYWKKVQTRHPCVLGPPVVDVPTTSKKCTGGKRICAQICARYIGYCSGTGAATLKNQETYCSKDTRGGKTDMCTCKCPVCKAPGKPLKSPSISQYWKEQGKDHKYTIKTVS